MPIHTSIWRALGEELRRGEADLSRSAIACNRPLDGISMQSRVPRQLSTIGISAVHPRPQLRYGTYGSVGKMHVGTTTTTTTKGKTGEQSLPPFSVRRSKDLGVRPDAAEGADVANNPSIAASYRCSSFSSSLAIRAAAPTATQGSLLVIRFLQSLKS